MNMKLVKNLCSARAMIAFLPLLSVSCITNSERESKPSQPNVLFIAVDDLKPMMGCYGDSLIKTPNLDKLAQTGVIFTNAHCQQAVCAPSRASILTGKRPDFTKIYDLKTLIRNKNPQVITLPQHFKDNGYTTAAVGKVFDVRSVDQGHDSISWSIAYEPIKGANSKGGGYVFEKNRISTEAPDVADSLTIDGEVLRNSSQLLKKFSEKDAPFFLAVGFHKPHLPFVAPKKYWDLYDRDDFQIHSFQEQAKGSPSFAYQPGWEIRSLYEDIPKSEKFSEVKQLELIHGYHACVSFIDQQIGLLLKQLDELGLRENTIIVLWGDHGWHLGDHDMWCKHSNYEQATRSPLIISYADKYKGISHAPTEFVDVFPSICDMAGVSAPANLDGNSLVPVMTGQKESVKDFAVSQFHRNGKLMGYAFRNERYRYIVWLKSNFKKDEVQVFSDDLVVARELYDYKNDPLETINVVDEEEYQAIRLKMEKQSNGFFQSQLKR